MGKTIGVVLSLKDKCSPVITKVAQKFGMTEKEAKKLNATLRQQAKVIDKQLTNAFKIGMGVIAGTVGVVATLTNKTIEYGDKVDKMSQKIGMSRKAYQEWNYIMGQNGGNVDSLQAGYKTLTAQMAGVQKGSKESVQLFRQLGVSVKDSSGQLRSQEDVFNDSVRAIQKIQNPTEKAILAQKLFGKAAIEMKPLLNQSSDSIDELREKAHKLGIVMEDDAVDSSVRLGDTLDDVKKAFGAIGLSLGTSLIPIVQKLADQLINNLPQIKATLLPALNAFANAIGFVCGHLDVIVPAVASLVGTFGALTIIPKITAFVVAFCNPVGALTIGIGALVAGLGIAYSKFEGFREMVNGVWAVIKLAGAGLWEVVKIFGSLCKWVGEGIMRFTLFGQLLSGIISAFKAIGQAFQSIGGFSAIGKSMASGADYFRGKLSAHALGTSYSKGGTALVGEYGPELVTLPQGSSVASASNTRSLLGGNGSHIEINWYVQGNVVGNREFMNEMSKYFATELRKVMPA